MELDTLIYCSNIEQLRQELKDNGFYNEEEDTYTHGNLLTPIKYNEVGATLSYVRNNKLDLALFPSLTDLGGYDVMFADDVAHGLYKSVYPYNVELFRTDENDAEVGYFLPIKIGVFA